MPNGSAESQDVPARRETNHAELKAKAVIRLEDWLAKREQMADELRDAAIEAGWETKRTCICGRPCVSIFPPGKPELRRTIFTDWLDRKPIYKYGLTHQWYAADAVLKYVGEVLGEVAK
jgi:hypothetical protein